MQRGVTGGAATPVYITGGQSTTQLVDGNGNPIEIVDGELKVIAEPKSWAIARGEIAGSYSVNKFGHNDAVGASLEPIWDQSGAYEYLADDTFSTMYISSDDSLDTGITYDVTGIDSNYNVVTVEATTDGADGNTFVALTGQWWRIFRAKNTSNTPAQGNIYISKDNTDAGGNGIPDDVLDIQAKVTIGFEQTLMALWSSPANHTTFLTGYYAATNSNKATEVHLYVRPFGGVFNNKHIITINQGQTHHKFDFPLRITEKSDIKIEATAAGGGGNVSAGFDLWYEQS